VGFASALLAICGTAVAIPIGTAPAGASAAPITIGLVTEFTGGAASQYIGAQDGAEARFAAQNAKGGVNGHQLKLVTVDDQSTPAGNQVAAQDLVENKGAFGVIDDSTVVYGASVYLHQAGVPVVGEGNDGPEWGQQPNTNMFDLIPPSITVFNGVTYGYNTDTVFLKAIGVTKLAVISVNVPSAITAQMSTMKEATRAGITNCYDNDSLPLSDVDFTAVALQLKASNCNGVILEGVPAQVVALSEAIQQAGIKLKQFYYTLTSSLLEEPAAHQALIGTYSLLSGVDFSDLTPAQKLMVKTIKKYVPQFSEINDQAAFLTYEAADLMIKGLEMAGKNPTRQSFITNLRKVPQYSAGGLLPPPGVTFQHFGTSGMLPKTGCSQFLLVTKNGLTPYENGKEICGTRITISSAGS
jgi:branched-chain amino acid transport system substrate-binding protein